MTTPKTRREQEFEAFKKAWEEYPSQDNEGFVPDRGGFKCGWFAALRWADSTPAPSEQGDEDAIEAWGKELDAKGEPRLVGMAPGFRRGAAHARRTQAAEIKKFREALEDMVDCVPGTEMYFAARDLAKIVLEDYAKLTSNAAQGGEG